jgi:hypothetical protein
MVVALLLLTILDGALTLLLIESHEDEANPLMAYLIQRGELWFVLGKYVLTAAGLPLLVVLKNYPMFGTRFRVGHLVPTFVALYLMLTVVQLSLISFELHRHSPALQNPVVRRAGAEPSHSSMVRVPH